VTVMPCRRTHQLAVGLHGFRQVALDDLGLRDAFPCRQSYAVKRGRLLKRLFRGLIVSESERGLSRESARRCANREPSPPPASGLGSVLTMGRGRGEEEHRGMGTRAAYEVPRA